ncbi:hypothetical protein CUU64_05100 [Bacillus sp. V5-8f]|nr:hypothetical protein CUU64_05100 [Bacillus sp. V5-8f]
MIPHAAYYLPAKMRELNFRNQKTASQLIGKLGAEGLVGNAAGGTKGLNIQWLLKRHAFYAILREYIIAGGG